MKEILNFVNNYYLVFLGISIFLILALVGYIWFYIRQKDVKISKDENVNNDISIDENVEAKETETL